jgi:hypothetical protein
MLQYSMAADGAVISPRTGLGTTGAFEAPKQGGDDELSPGSRFAVEARSGDAERSQDCPTAA